jgi:hypothetical protein
MPAILFLIEKKIFFGVFMPLTSKLRADYIELINQQLDNLSIETIEDFDLVREALSHIMLPEPRYITRSTYAVPEKYQESMDYIKSFLDEPESHVEDRANDHEYKHIIRDRITAKINELQALSEPQKQAYIQVQSNRRFQARANQATMSQHQAPAAGSEAHSLSSQQLYEEWERAFNSDNPTDTTIASALPRNPTTNPRTLDLRAHNAGERTVTALALAFAFADIPVGVTSLDLSAHGGLLGVRNEDDTTPLSRAIENNNLDVVRLMLNSGVFNPGTPFQTEIPAIPPPGNNDALLTEMNFSGEIPREYICPLSSNIMDDPVYDPNDPLSARFERSSIMALLAQREEIPLNLQPLISALRASETILVSDTRLQGEINDFVQRSIHINPSP